MRGRSTSNNLLVLQEFVMSAFSDSSEVDCVYLDFSKAFDKVNHKILIAKLESYGICGPLLQWMHSYLSDRSLIVGCEGSLFDPFPVPSGVPQGSHCGPILLYLYINDLKRAVTSKILLFADDLKIFSRVDSALDLEALQQSLDDINQWCESNAMELNVTKCFVMSFRRNRTDVTSDYMINGINLKTVEKIRDLDVLMTTSLNPFEHVVLITNKAASTLTW